MSLLEVQSQETTTVCVYKNPTFHTGMIKNFKLFNLILKMSGCFLFDTDLVLSPVAQYHRLL